MSFVSNILSSWAKDEDDELWEVYHKLYGPALELSFTFPSWRRSRLPLTLLIFGYYAIIFPFHIALLSVSIDCVRDDFNMASMEFHFWMIFMFSSISILLMNSNRQSMMKLHRTLTIGVGKYKAGRIYNEDYPVMLERKKPKQTIKFLFLPGLVMVLAGLTLLIPYVKNMDGTVEYNHRGANMKLPIAACYPFPTHEGITYLLAVAGQFMAAGGLALVIATLDLLLFRMTQSVIFEYEVLIYALQTMSSRAKKLYRITYPNSNIKEVRTKDEAFQRCIGECIRDCIVHHHDIIKIVKEYMNLVKWPGLLAYGFGTGVIGLSLVNILSAKEAGNYENIILFMLLMIAEVLNMFMISSFGEAITTESKVLREQLYFIDWPKLDTQNRKMMLNFQVGINNPVILKVGGIVNVTLDTFSSIMNTSYSFFNLVNAQ
uniref:Odorant receptor n=1 Tax=Adelphocoris lineolatus TaxID=236346 RepID=A0A2I4PH69_ADELI|nr:olfactory receptor 68 [Adelphocoris lineolatus]